MPKWVAVLSVVALTLPTSETPHGIVGFAADQFVMGLKMFAGLP